MNIPPPTAEKKLTKKEAQVANRKRLYKINTDFATSAKHMLAQVHVKDLQETLAAYMSIVTQPTQEEDIEVAPQTLQQMALFASVTLSRIIMERYK
jgi:hypothetical protein